MREWRWGREMEKREGGMREMGRAERKNRKKGGRGRGVQVTEKGRKVYLLQGKATREAEEEDGGCCCVWRCYYGRACCCGEIGLPWGGCCVHLEEGDGGDGERRDGEKGATAGGKEGSE